MGCAQPLALRSWSGDRDSEICAVLSDTPKSMVKGKMGGKEVLVGRFARSLRQRLWMDYLGDGGSHSI